MNPLYLRKSAFICGCSVFSLREIFLRRGNITAVDTINWLLDSDPAISWQTMRDLTDTSHAAIAAERARIPYEGIGAEILARQESNGSWRRADEPVWLSTLFTMLLLRATGIDRAEPVVESAVTRLEASLCWSDHDGFWELRPAESGGNPFFEGEVEPCINGGVLALGAYFGRPTERRPLDHASPASVLPGPNRAASR